MSTEDIGLKDDTRLLCERDRRLLDTEEFEVRADMTDDDGLLERGVEMSELDTELLYWNEAIEGFAGGEEDGGCREEEKTGGESAGEDGADDVGRGAATLLLECEGPVEEEWQVR